MSCEIKNEKCPFQIQCRFPMAATNRQPFALYFNPFQGRSERVLGCEYNGHYRCFDDKGFKETHNGYNNVTITVPDTFAPREGFFYCQKGDISVVKTCSYHPPEICDDISSTKSGIGLETTTKGDSTPIPVVPITVAVGISPFVIISCCLLFMIYRSSSREGSKERTIYIRVPSDVTIQEREKLSRRKENTGNNVEQSPIARAPERLMGTNNPAHCDNVLIVNEHAANDGQGHPSTGNRTSCASSEIQPTLPSSVSSNGSDNLLLSS